MGLLNHFSLYFSYIFTIYIYNSIKQLPHSGGAWEHPPLYSLRDKSHLLQISLNRKSHEKKESGEGKKKSLYSACTQSSSSARTGLALFLSFFVSRNGKWGKDGEQDEEGRTARRGKRVSRWGGKKGNIIFHNFVKRCTCGALLPSVVLSTSLTVQNSPSHTCCVAPSCALRPISGEGAEQVNEMRSFVQKCESGKSPSFSIWCKLCV